MSDLSKLMEVNNTQGIGLLNKMATPLNDHNIWGKGLFPKAIQSSLK
jgi:hypothetical protein